jgi:hypothetical protein
MSKLANETSVLEDRRYINEGKRRLNGIILVPQPTDDPRDPLVSELLLIRTPAQNS